MQKPLISLALSGILLAGMSSGAVFAKTDNAAQQAPAATQAAPTAGGERHHHAMDPDKQVKHLSKKLNLSADQQSQIKPILADRQQQMQAIHEDQTLSPKDRRAKAMSVRDDSDAKIEAVLNDTQKQQFEQMKQQMRERHNHKNGAEAAAPAPAPQQ